MMATVIASGKNIDQGMLGPLAAFALYAASLNFAATPAMGAAKLRWALECVDCDRKGRLRSWLPLSNPPHARHTQ